MIFSRAITTVVLAAVVAAAVASTAAAADPPPPSIEYVGEGEDGAVCPPPQTGWSDTSVSERMQFCAHDDHGAMSAQNAWALYEEQSLRSAQAGAADSGSPVGRTVNYNRATPWNVYPDGDGTHWRTVARNYNTWVDRSGCTRLDGTKCEKISIPSSDAAKCRQLEIPSGLGYQLAGGYTC